MTAQDAYFMHQKIIGHLKTTAFIFFIILAFLIVYSFLNGTAKSRALLIIHSEYNIHSSFTVSQKSTCETRIVSRVFHSTKQQKFL
jgi:hypothetical protein